jgi:hypothetical protein
MCRWPLLALLVLGAGCSASAGGTTAGGHPDPVTSITVGGAFAGIHAGETRAHVERLVGRGRVVLTIARHSNRAGHTLQHVWYAASRLTVVYTRSGHRPQRVIGVLTTSPRYHTPSGLRVGASLAQARRTPGVRCFYQVTFFACEGGKGFEKPVTSFTVLDGHVVRAFMVAVAD